MITDQNVVLISRGPINVRVHHDARFYCGVAARLDGDGTRECPLHFVFLACHSDMADETPIATTERLTRALADDVLTRLRNEHGDLRDILQSSNAAAAATGRYYSIAAGRVTNRDVIVGAVGSVEAIIARGNAREAIITPNVVRIGEHAILNGAFGIGFKQEAVQLKQLDLEEDGMVVLVIGEDAAAIGSHSRQQDAEGFIADLVRTMRISPPIVSVVR